MAALWLRGSVAPWLSPTQLSSSSSSSGGRLRTAPPPQMAIVMPAELFYCSTASSSVNPGSGKENPQENTSSHLQSHECVGSSRHLFITVAHALLDSKSRFSSLDERKMSPVSCFDSNF